MFKINLLRDHPLMTDFARTQICDNSPFLGYGFSSEEKKMVYFPWYVATEYECM